MLGAVPYGPSTTFQLLLGATPGLLGCLTGNWLAVHPRGAFFATIMFHASRHHPCTLYEEQTRPFEFQLAGGAYTPLQFVLENILQLLGTSEAHCRFPSSSLCTRTEEEAPSRQDGTQRQSPGTVQVGALRLLVKTCCPSRNVRKGREERGWRERVFGDGEDFRLVPRFCLAHPKLTIAPIANHISRASKSATCI